MHGQSGIYNKNVGLGAYKGDRRKILLRTIGEILVETFVGGKNAVVAHQQRVAVRRCVRHELSRYIAASPWLVLNHERLAKQLLHLFSDDPRKHVAWSTRCKCHDDRHGTVWVTGGRRQRRKNYNRGEGDVDGNMTKRTYKTSHIAPLTGWVLKQTV